MMQTLPPFMIAWALPDLRFLGLGPPAVPSSTKRVPLSRLAWARSEPNGMAAAPSPASAVRRSQSILPPVCPKRTFDGGSASFRPVADRLDIVPVGIMDEGGIIIRMVMRSDAGPAIVTPARGQRRLVKGINLGPRIDGKGDMRPFTDPLIVADPEEWLSVRPEAMRRPA